MSTTSTISPAATPPPPELEELMPAFVVSGPVLVSPLELVPAPPAPVVPPMPPGPPVVAPALFTPAAPPMLLEPIAPPASPSVVAVAAVAWDAGFVVLVVSACVEVPSLLGG